MRYFCEEDAELDEVWDAGWRAANTGRPRTDNPYRSLPTTSALLANTPTGLIKDLYEDILKAALSTQPTLRKVQGVQSDSTVVIPKFDTETETP